MKIATIKSGGSESAAVVIPRGYVRLDVFNEEKRTEWPTVLDELVSSGEAERLNRWYLAGGKAVLANISRTFVVPQEEAEVIGEIFKTEDEE